MIPKWSETLQLLGSVLVSNVVASCYKWKRTYRLWMDGTFEDLDGASMEEITENFYKETQRMQKAYRQKIKQQVTENYKRRFKGNMDDPDVNNHPAPLKLCYQVGNPVCWLRSQALAKFPEMN